MSISVQQLVQTAFQNCSLIGDGESVDGTAYGTATEGALGLLNNLMSELNNNGFIPSSRRVLEAVTTSAIHPVYESHIYGSGIVFCGKEWQGDIPEGYYLERNGVPEKIEGVSRKIGDRWLPLKSCDMQQMMQRNMAQLATSWTYNLVRGNTPPQGDSDAFGMLTLDTRRPTPIRVFFNEKIPVIHFDGDFIYVSDIYFDLLLNGLCVKLCVKYKLIEYLPLFEQQFKQAKNLIKRSNATQRMLQRGDLGGGYNDSYFNGLGGVGW